MKKNKYMFTLVLMFTLFFSISFAWAENYTEKFSKKENKTYEQLFLDPNFAKLIAYHTNSDVSDVVKQSKLDEIKILSNLDGSNRIIDNLFDISGISNLRNLERIELSGMDIISIPDEIRMLNSLQYVDLSNNEIVYVSNFIFELPLLKELYIDGNNINVPLKTFKIDNLKEYSFSNQNTMFGNVPNKFIPQSNIIFDSNGAPILTEVIKPTPIPIGAKELDGVQPEDYIPGNDENSNDLPVYNFNEYYIAKPGAKAQYGSDGELIRIRGDYEYITDIEKYLVNEEFPNGKYIGNISIFSIDRENTLYDKVSGYSSKKPIKGYFTTYGDFWPEIPSSDTDSNRDPVPNRGRTTDEHIKYYGDRIGTKNNKLRIGDVATRKSDEIAYDTKIEVTVIDENNQKKISRTMTVRDIMGATRPALDIWRWDSPDWFTGKPRRPNDVYFGKTYSKNTSFTNVNNYFTY